MDPSLPLLNATDLAFATPAGLELHRGLSFKLMPGHILLITGENGSGKTTLLRLILGQQSPTHGQLFCRVNPSQIAYLPQLQNIQFHLPATLGDILNISRPSNASLQETLSLKLLTEHHLKMPWNTASGGERQRLLMTRALLAAPKLLILDEPLNHLDLKSKKQLAQAFKDFLETPNQERGIVLVSHVTPDELESLSIPVTRLKLEPVERSL